MIRYGIMSAQISHFPDIVELIQQDFLCEAMELALISEWKPWMSDTWADNNRIDIGFSWAFPFTFFLCRRVTWTPSTETWNVTFLFFNPLDLKSYWNKSNWMGINHTLTMPMRPMRFTFKLSFSMPHIFDRNLEMFCILTLGSFDSVSSNSKNDMNFKWHIFCPILAHFVGKVGKNSIFFAFWHQVPSIQFFEIRKIRIIWNDKIFWPILTHFDSFPEIIATKASKILHFDTRSIRFSFIWFEKWH